MLHSLESAQVVSIRKANQKVFFVKYNVIFLFVLMVVISAILSPDFLTFRNITNLMKQQAPALVATIGMLCVLMTGGIDLSIGANAALANIILGTMVTTWGWNSPSGLIIGILLSIIISTVIGLLVGLMSSFLKLPSFLVTLALSFSLRGLANMFSDGVALRVLDAQSNVAHQSLIWFSSTKAQVLGIPLSFIFALVVCGAFAFLLNKTVFGRLMLATGSNSTAVNLAGINIKFYQTSAFIITGFLAGITGLMLASRATIYSPAAGADYEMNAIAGAVIGGASMMGGRASVFCTILGVFVLAMILNIMNLLSIPPYPQAIFKGVIIILAVLMQTKTSIKSD